MSEDGYRKPKRGRGVVRLIVVLTILVVLTAGGVFAWKVLVDGPSRKDTTTETYDEPVSRLDLLGGSGSVDIVSGDGDKVTVTTSVQWTGDNKPGTDQKLTGETLKVAAAGCDGIDLFGVIACEVNIRVEVPADTEVKAEVDSGDLAVAGITGAQELACDSGNIEVTGSGEKLAISADSGDVDARDLRATTVKADVDSGNSELVFETAPKQIEADADSGDMTLSVPKADGGYDIDIAVDSGDKTIEVATDSSSAHKIDGNVDSGDLTVDYS